MFSFSAYKALYLSAIKVYLVHCWTKSGIKGGKVQEEP